MTEKRPAPGYCLSCDKQHKLAHGGFCDTCVAVFEDEIALDDVPRPERGGRIYYGVRLPDRFPA